ncbi:MULTISPECIES: MFS transporter [Rhizobium/Agrobacterium group]|uniref:MFS transporter n=2 Tax=Neorhizobium TaxID=1525371 RepID=A0ABV0M3B2_9HYPH|nr:MULTISPECIES: MFS transporter [Rhizobium/Agrobacterium group]MCC2609363.1 MFS transporter [Neorhizobium petrolearium]WGI69577.1 MFS transporter [Neorhizobium petrolearium]
MNVESQTFRTQAALFLSLAVFTTGQSFLLVVLPPLGRRLGFADLHIGGILSLSALLIMVSAPAWGYLSERVGRRPVLLTALAGATLGSMGFGVIVYFRLSGVLSVFVALILIALVRATQTLVTSGILPAAQAYMADITTPAQRAGGMGTLGAAIGVGAIAGAALAWRVAAGNPALAFAVIAMLAAIALLSMLLAKEPVRTASMTISDARLPLGQIWPFLAITLASISAYSILQQVTALRLQDSLGFTVEESIARGGAALMATALAMIVVQACAVRVFRWKATRLLGVGAITAAIAMLICTFVTTYSGIFATLILLGIGLGLMLTGNLASLSLQTGRGAQGKVAGVNVLAQGLGQAIGPIAGAGLHRISPQIPFFAATTLLAMACFVAAISRRSTATNSTISAEFS